MLETKVAKRYAKSLLGLSREMNVLDAVGKRHEAAVAGVRGES